MTTYTRFPTVSDGRQAARDDAAAVSGPLSPASLASIVKGGGFSEADVRRWEDIPETSRSTTFRREAFIHGEKAPPGWSETLIDTEVGIMEGLVLGQMYREPATEDELNGARQETYAVWMHRMQNNLWVPTPEGSTSIMPSRTNQKRTLTYERYQADAQITFEALFKPGGQDHWDETAEQVVRGKMATNYVLALVDTFRQGTFYPARKAREGETNHVQAAIHLARYAGILQRRKDGLNALATELREDFRPFGRKLTDIFIAHYAMFNEALNNDWQRLDRSVRGAENTEPALENDVLAFQAVGTGSNLARLHRVPDVVSINGEMRSPMSHRRRYARHYLNDVQPHSDGSLGGFNYDDTEWQYVDPATQIYGTGIFSNHGMGSVSEKRIAEVIAGLMENNTAATRTVINRMRAAGVTPAPWIVPVTAGETGVKYGSKTVRGARKMAELSNVSMADFTAFANAVYTWMMHNAPSDKYNDKELVDWVKSRLVVDGGVAMETTPARDPDTASTEEQGSSVEERLVPDLASMDAPTRSALASLLSSNHLSAAEKRFLTDASVYTGVNTPFEKTMGRSWASQRHEQDGTEGEVRASNRTFAAFIKREVAPVTNQAAAASILRNAAKHAMKRPKGNFDLGKIQAWYDEGLSNQREPAAPSTSRARVANVVTMDTGALNKQGADILARMQKTAPADSLRQAIITMAMTMPFTGAQMAHLMGMGICPPLRVLAINDCVEIAAMDAMGVDLFARPEVTRRDPGTLGIMHTDTEYTVQWEDPKTSIVSMKGVMRKRFVLESPVRVNCVQGVSFRGYNRNGTLEPRVRYDASGEPMRILQNTPGTTAYTLTATKVKEVIDTRGVFDASVSREVLPERRAQTSLCYDSALWVTDTQRIAERTLQPVYTSFPGESPLPFESMFRRSESHAVSPVSFRAKRQTRVAGQDRELTGGTGPLGNLYGPTSTSILRGAARYPIAV